MVQPAITRPPAGRAPGARDSGGASSIREPGRQRYNLILRIVHPLLDPAVITTALAWEPDQSWKCGDRAVTPRGTILRGVRSDGLWSRSFRYHGKVSITEKLEQILQHLEGHRGLFDDLATMQARSAIYVQLPGDTNIGARIPWEILKKLADLKIAFEFESFPKWV